MYIDEFIMCSVSKNVRWKKCTRKKGVRFFLSIKIQIWTWCVRPVPSFLSLCREMVLIKNSDDRIENSKTKHTQLQIEWNYSTVVVVVGEQCAIRKIPRTQKRTKWKEQQLMPLKMRRSSLTQFNVKRAH